MDALISLLKTQFNRGPSLVKISVDCLLLIFKLPVLFPLTPTHLLLFFLKLGGVSKNDFIRILSKREFPRLLVALLVDLCRSRSIDAEDPFFSKVNEMLEMFSRGDEFVRETMSTRVFVKGL